MNLKSITATENHRMAARAPGQCELINDRLVAVYWSAFIFVGFFVLYQFSLALHPIKFPLYPNWSFAADSMEEVLKGISTTLAGRKHPLFQIVARPLYYVGTKLYSGIPGPLGENLALTFPIALIGATNICLSFSIFRSNHPNTTMALLFTFLCGTAAAAWIFFSFPETYALTTLCTTFFLRTFLRQRNNHKMTHSVAAANALACYASPQQILLAIIPCYHYLQRGQWSKQSVLQVARYLVILGILFIIPYELYLEIVRLGWKLAPGYVLAYAKFDNFLVPVWYLVVLMNFLVFSVVGPVMHPALYTDPTLGALSHLTVSWVLITGIYLIIAIRAFWGLRTTPATYAHSVPGILIYLAATMLFFLFFNPSEAFLYALPNLLLWLLVIHSGFAGNSNWKWQAIMLFSVLGTATNNFHLISFMNSLR